MIDVNQARIFTVCCRSANQGVLAGALQKIETAAKDGSFMVAINVRDEWKPDLMSDLRQLGFNVFDRRGDILVTWHSPLASR